jgi:hypothetical protein
MNRRIFQYGTWLADEARARLAGRRGAAVRVPPGSRPGCAALALSVGSFMVKGRKCENDLYELLVVQITECPIGGADVVAHDAGRPAPGTEPHILRLPELRPETRPAQRTLPA